jgi:ABC-type transporter Mla subunit MlaD
MRRALLAILVLAGIAAVVVLGTGAAAGPSKDPTYKIELDNAFGIVTGADFKVEGVTAGTISAINLDQQSLDAVVTVKVTTLGIPPFHTSATCDSEPQSLIGEYFISCDPGTTGDELSTGATIGVTHTTSTIPADLVLDIMQVPERERLPLIINSLGAGVAARSGDIASALDRALPALRDTDDLLSLLDTDKRTLASLTANADTVVTALADNGHQIQRFITYANRAAVDTATQRTNLQSGLQKLPGFLAALRPNVEQLGDAAQANVKPLALIGGYSGQLDTLFTALPAFSKSAIPAIRALGTASVTGRAAVSAAKTTVGELKTASVHIPELAKNLAIVTPDLNTQSNAVETNPRSPGGKGYSGLEALLQFAFNLAAATNYYGPTGHLLGVDGFLSPECTPYATPQTVADNLATYGSAYRDCYAFLGPNQPGVNETDPSNPSACVPDPGGEPPGVTATVATPADCKLEPGGVTTPASTATTASQKAAVPTAGGPTTRAGSAGASPPTTPTTPTTPQTPNPPSLGGTVATTLGTVSSTLSSITHTVSGVASLLGGTHPTPGHTTHTTPTSTHTTPTSTTAASTAATQSLLNYLLGP